MRCESCFRANHHLWTNRYFLMVLFFGSCLQKCMKRPILTVIEIQSLQQGTWYQSVWWLHKVQAELHKVQAVEVNTQVTWFLFQGDVVTEQRAEEPRSTSSRSDLKFMLLFSVDVLSFLFLWRLKLRQIIAISLPEEWFSKSRKQLTRSRTNRILQHSFNVNLLK